MSKGVPRKGWKMKPILAPCLHPTTLDIAWFAGILEGEGYFNRRATTQSVEVSQRDPWILDKIRNLFGGSLAKYKNQGMNRRDQWRWRACGARARGIMMTIYLFMSPKRKVQIEGSLDVKSAHLRPRGYKHGFCGLCGQPKPKHDVFDGEEDKDENENL